MTLKSKLARIFSRDTIKPGMIFGIIIFTALFAFEIFNYSTTDFALRDLLGELQFANIRWATILAIAFCGIDFAGIARLFTPQQGSAEPKEVWYLFGAWLLAATMNAMLTWWGVSMAIANHTVLSSSVVDPATLIKVVPIFVSVLVWLIRILIIGTISQAADHLIWGSAKQRKQPARRRPATALNQTPRPVATTSTNVKPRPSFNRPLTSNSANLSSRPEPTYHSMANAGSINNSKKQL